MSPCHFYVISQCLTFYNSMSLSSLIMISGPLFTQIILLCFVPKPEGGGSDSSLHVYPEVSFNKYLNLNTLSNSEPGDKIMHLCSPSMPQPPPFPLHLTTLTPTSADPPGQIVLCNR